MPKASKARRGYWRFDPSARLTHAQEEFVVNDRGCPLCTNGSVHRIAERQGELPWRWVSVGWRCAACGTCYIDVEKQV